MVRTMEDATRERFVYYHPLARRPPLTRRRRRGPEL